jgi:hypothetical protein
MLYPVLGPLLGRSPVQCIYPGMLPCATTAFGLVLLAASVPKVNKLTYVLMLIWAIPFAPLVQIPVYHVYEDSIMFLIGIYASISRTFSWVIKYDKNLEKFIFGFISFPIPSSLV